MNLWLVMIALTVGDGAPEVVVEAPAIAPSPKTWMPRVGWWQSVHTPYGRYYDGGYDYRREFGYPWKVTPDRAWQRACPDCPTSPVPEGQALAPPLAKPRQGAADDAVAHPTPARTSSPQTVPQSGKRNTANPKLSFFRGPFAHDVTVHKATYEEPLPPHGMSRSEGVDAAATQTAR